MTVNRYLFQSPSTSQVQVGRLDLSSQEKDTSSQTSEAPGTQAQPIQQPKAEDMQTNSSQVEPTVDTQSIDIYV